MSKELRDELEKLQSEIVAVTRAISATASRIPEARAHAKSAEAALAVVKDPLEALQLENRALEKQIKWENSQARPSIWPLLIIFAAGFLLMLGKVI